MADAKELSAAFDAKVRAVAEFEAQRAAEFYEAKLALVTAAMAALIDCEVRPAKASGLAITYADDVIAQLRTLPLPDQMLASAIRQHAAQCGAMFKEEQRRAWGHAR